MNKKARKRVALFERGVAGYASCTGDSRGLYRCPICLTGYGREEAETGRLLTLEHVPPESIGGRRIALTCRECNSESGRTVDAALDRLQHWASLPLAVRGVGSYAGPAEVTLAGVTLNAELALGPDGNQIAVPRERNNPAEYDEAMGKLESSGGAGVDISVQTTHRFNTDHAGLSLLRAGYLAAFARFGYTFALHARLAQVREQILRPDERLLKRAVWVSGEGRVALPMMLLVRLPFPMVFIRIDHATVLLPWIEGPDDFYEAIPVGVGPREEMRMDVRATPVSWPATLVLALDKDEAR